MIFFSNVCFSESWGIIVKKIFFYFLVFLLIAGCVKKPFDENEEYYLNDNAGVVSGDSSEKINLPVSYERLETFLGDNFVPVFSIKENINNDAEKEACIAYKKNESSNIHLVFFKFIRKNIIKRLFEIETDISDSDSFVFKVDNLFFEDDIAFIIEGKSVDQKNLLYIYSYIDNNNEYELVHEFTADYSVIINYDEKEKEEGKYYLLRDVETVDDFSGLTNTNIQEKKVYRWNEVEKKFELSEMTKLLYTSNSINPSIYSSEDKFLDYLNGFWYPEEYKELIDNSSLNVDDFKNNNIEFISFLIKSNQINIKYDDYLNNFKIDKVKRLWGNRPGLRISINETSELINSSKTELEVYLMEANMLKVKGPNRFDERDYVRLPRSFIDYVNDIKNEKNKNGILQIVEKLQSEYKTDDDIVLKFDENSKYVLEQEGISENGVYKITYDDLGYIISFLSEKKSKLLPYNNFVIKLSEDSAYFTLVPVKINLNNISINDIRSITFYKFRGRG